MSNLARFSQAVRDQKKHMVNKIEIVQTIHKEVEKKKEEFSQKRKIAYTNCNMPIKAGYTELICKSDLPPQCYTVEDYIAWRIREDEQYFRRKSFVRVELVSNEDYAHILRKWIEENGGIEDENCMLLDDWIDSVDRSRGTKLYNKDGNLLTPHDYMKLKK